MIASQWKNWIGPKRSSAEHLSEAFARRWLATLDLPQPAGDAMPQGVHFCLANPAAPTAMLGTDGHPRRDMEEPGFLPPIPLPRRMWAGSSITFHAPLRIGVEVVRNSRMLSVTEKTGGAGRLVFVEVEHEVLADGALSLREAQTIVFREAAATDAPLSPPPADIGSFNPAEWEAHRTLTPDPPLLLRYSALTFNAHRIHYDLPYAQEVERYRGLVVHGPLLASLLLQLAARRLGDNGLREFSFRGLSPAIAGEPLHLVMRRTGEELDLAAFAGDGRQVTRASARLSPAAGMA